MWDDGDYVTIEPGNIYIKGVYKGNTLITKILDTMKTAITGEESFVDEIADQKIFKDMAEKHNSDIKKVLDEITSLEKGLGEEPNTLMHKLLTEAGLQ